MKSREVPVSGNGRREVAVAGGGFTVLRVYSMAEDKVHLITVRDTSSQRVKSHLEAAEPSPPLDKVVVECVLCAASTP